MLTRKVPPVRRGAIRATVQAALVLTAAAAAHAQSGLQITPNRARTLISKDLGGQRWAITYNADDNTVTGNVFLPGGGDPQFVYCEQISSSATEIQFGCYGAGPCDDALCPSSAWTFLTNVGLPVGFVTPRGNAVCGNGVVEPGEFCDPPGVRAQCPTDSVCSADCRGCSPLPTCQLWQPLLGTLASGTASCVLRLVLDNRACGTTLDGLAGTLECSNGSADVSGLLGGQVPGGAAGSVTFNASGCLGAAYVSVRAHGVTKTTNAVNCSSGSTCGDGLLGPGEECDPGNEVYGCPTFPDLLVCNPYSCQCEQGIL